MGRRPGRRWPSAAPPLLAALVAAGDQPRRLILVDVRSPAAAAAIRSRSCSCMARAPGHRGIVGHSVSLWLGRRGRFGSPMPRRVGAPEDARLDRSRPAHRAGWRSPVAPSLQVGEDNGGSEVDRDGGQRRFELGAKFTDSKASPRTGRTVPCLRGSPRCAAGTPPMLVVAGVHRHPVQPGAEGRLFVVECALR